MSNVDARVLGELVRSALEQTAFVFAEAVEADASSAGPGDICAEIGFTGSRRGIVRICASAGFARQVAAGFLSLQPDEVDAKVHGSDAIGEMANIIAGLVIRTIGGEDVPISLGLPARMSTGAAAPAPSGAVCCEIESEGERLRVTYLGDVAAVKKAA